MQISARTRETLVAYLFVAPDTIGLATFVGLPMVMGLAMGFFKVSGFGEYQFIGLANYARIFGDPYVAKSLSVTALYTLIVVPGLYVASLGLALLLQQKIPLVGLFRTLFFIPHVVSVVVIGTIIQFLTTSKVGVINRMLASIGLPGQSWLGDPALALYTVAIASIWFQMGFFMVVILAGLQEIPREYYEAAKVDGAKYWQSLWSITLPMLKPTSFFVVLITAVNSIAGGGSIDLIISMTKGGPARATSLAPYYVYQQAFEVGDYGYAAALATVLVAVMMLLTGALFLLSRGGRFVTD